MSRVTENNFLSSGGLGVLVALLILVGLVLYTDHRFDRLESITMDNSQLSLPPSSYSKPKLNHVEEIPAGKWQSTYVPIYSHLYHDGGRPISLECTLLLRNTSENKEVIFRRVDYYDSDGQKVRSELNKPFSLAPLQSVAFLVKEGDHIGGVGANFIVQWLAPPETSPPHIEAVMIGPNRRVSFKSSGQLLIEGR